MFHPAGPGPLPQRRRGLRRSRRRAAGRRVRAVIAACLLGAAGWLALGGARAPAEAEVAVWDVQVPVPRRDPAAAAALLEQAAAELARRPVTLTWEGQVWHLPLHELGVALDTGALVAAGARLAGLPHLPEPLPAVLVRARIDEQALAAALAPAAAAVARAPVPARLLAAGEGVEVSADKPGRRLDLPGVITAVRDALGRSGGPRWRPGEPLPVLAVALPVRPVAAVPTAADLHALGVRRRIATFSTAYDASVPRGENVERAAGALDGLLLAPGAVLSYNSLVGPVDAGHGWQPAWVIVGGDLVRGVGGGICQVATTLYGAALRSGLEVLERHPHSLSVSYIDPSQDAAVAPGIQDLKLRNTGRSAVYFRAEAGGGRVTVHVYGDLPPGQDMEVASEVVARTPAGTRTVVDPNLAPGERRVADAGAPAIRSRGWRIVRQDGQEVRRELLSEDSYPGRPRVERVGPAR